MRMYGNIAYNNSMKTLKFKLYQSKRNKHLKQSINVLRGRSITIALRSTNGITGYGESI